MSEKSSFVVSAEWLQNHLGSPGLSIVDASWYLPATGRNAFAEYEAAHIEGAIFFDQDKIVDVNSELSHTLPSPEDFACFASAMGISNEDTIVVYDGPGFFSAPRVWWMFRLMGAEKVFVLDGGFDGWKKEGRPVSAKKTKIAPCTFHVSYHDDRVVFLEEMREIVAWRLMQIVDARGAGRFTGEEPEPRPNMKSGHMPGARNIPSSLFSHEGKFKSLPELKEIMLNAGVDPQKPVVTTCGSGVTAAVVALALESLGNKKARLYDGSWSEWGALLDTPVERGKVK